jgi:hypothetical protein
MSGTRTAKDDSVFHQAKFASSPDFEHGLYANLVAKRCALLPTPDARELVWFVQYLSHHGGLPALAKELIEKSRHRLGPRAMVALAKSAGDLLDAGEVLKIRSELPRHLRGEFPLRGEIDKGAMSAISAKKRSAEWASIDMGETYQDREANKSRIRAAQNCDAEEAVVHALAAQHPEAYSAESFLTCCVACAMQGGQCGDESLTLERELARICLDPACDLDSGPWYFADLINVLREYQQQWKLEKSKVYVTALGKIVCEEMEFTLKTRSLSLLEGGARLGKSFSAKAWCEQRPGKARFVEVSSGNDEASFFRDLARGLGLGNFLNYKVVQIRARVESVLLTGDILLVLDEAQRLWPQRRMRDGFPGRVVWVMTMVNAGVPICMISTPQFIAAQKAIEQTGWNSAQLTGRISNYKQLPTELAVEDLMAVGRVVLPEVGTDVLKALAIYARSSARYLAAVDSIAKRAHYIAQRAGRPHCITDDVRTAMKESVIPSDTMLLQTLEAANKSQGRRRATAPAGPQVESPAPPAARDTRPTEPAQMGFRDRAGVPAELIQE